MNNRYIEAVLIFFTAFGLSLAVLWLAWHFVEEPWHDRPAEVEAFKREQAAHAAYMRGCVPTTSEARCNELWRWTVPATGNAH